LTVAIVEEWRDSDCITFQKQMEYYCYQYIHNLISWWIELIVRRVCNFFYQIWLRQQESIWITLLLSNSYLVTKWWKKSL